MEEEGNDKRGRGRRMVINAVFTFPKECYVTLALKDSTASNKTLFMSLIKTQNKREGKGICNREVGAQK